ncbi:MAG: hypothetical protein IPG89_02105 [Bacteroidetes bacterium]|nr:hypothetical protein [Bacteroidota bacterium]
MKSEDGEKKSYCFEIIPAKPSLENETHRELAVFFGQFSPGVYPMTFYIERKTGLMERQKSIYQKVLAISNN